MERGAEVGIAVGTYEKKKRIGQRKSQTQKKRKRGEEKSGRAADLGGGV